MPIRSLAFSIVGLFMLLVFALTMPEPADAPPGAAPAAVAVPSDWRDRITVVHVEPTEAVPTPAPSRPGAAREEVGVDSADTAPPPVTVGRPAGAEPPGRTWQQPASILWDNGPIVNCVGCGVGGADESVLQSASLGMSTLGFGHQLASNNSVADEFTVTDAAGWQLNQITFFAYQTGSTTSSTITGVYVRIWDGPPNGGGSIVWGDLTTNRLTTTGWSGVYRVDESTSGASTDRPVMAVTAATNVGLVSGTYWIEWRTDGTLLSGPWAPPITISGLTTTGNALQWIGSSGTWSAALDGGTLTQQGFPFIVEGTIGATASIEFVKTVGTVAGVCATENVLYAPVGTLATYCYAGTNVGTAPLTVHDLVDDQLGVLLDGFPLTLNPGAGVEVIVSGVPIGRSVHNSAVWTAYGTGTATASASAVVHTPGSGSISCTTGTVQFASDIPAAWSVINNAPGGPVWTNVAGCGESGNFTNGTGEAACVSSDIFGTAEFDTELRSNSFSLSGMTAATLHYTANYQNFAFLDVLDLDISSDGGATWTTLLSWQEDHGAFRAQPGEDVAVNLDAYAGMSNLRMRWHYYDPNTGDWDWYAQVDNVFLQCVSAATATPTPTRTATPTRTPTITPRPSNTPTRTPTKTPTPSPSAGKIYLPSVMLVEGYITRETEPNESPAAASGPMGSGIRVTGAITSPGDRDYFYFDLMQTRAVALSLTNIPVGNDYNLALVDATGTLINGYWSANPGSDFITTAPLPPDRYFIYVVYGSGPGSSSSYYLEADFD